ncbi:MAG: class I SAM-dependent methyltransferase [Burkholderiales bacterium]|nr:class I SAM-dependent methyltransferase [Burkholderiales bacterium]
MFDSKCIPGMIEPIEQDLLRDVALSAGLQPGEVVCEFGAFFGRSTMALAAGLLEAGIDPAAHGAPALVTYDLFSCSTHANFHRSVRYVANEAGVGHLLATAHGRIDFLPVFDHYLRGLPPGLVERRRARLADARHDGRPIAAMHIDAPKWYEEYMQVLREFGPSLKPGALVVLQDYFYHWSATLVAMVQVMLDRQVLQPLETAASSLLVRTRQPLTAALIEEFDASYRGSDPLALVRRAIATFEGFDMDRPEIFLARLHMAGLQLARELGREDEAAAFLRGVDAGREHPAAATMLADDWADLTHHEFSQRRLYEVDVQADGAA